MSAGKFFADPFQKDRWLFCHSSDLKKQQERRCLPVDGVLFLRYNFSFCLTGLKDVWNKTLSVAMSKSIIQYNWNSTSLCSPCFYGSICQFTTSYYSISTEALPDTFIQSKRTIASVLFILLISTICNVLSIAVFCQAKPRQMGNGIYRLWITIIGQLGTMVLSARLLRIFGRQGSGIIDCFGLEYLISVLPAIYYSLTACVAIERVAVAYQHLSFNLDRSRHVARIVVPSLILYHFLVVLYEPFHRRLLVDTQSSDRLWCSLDLHTWFLNTYERTTNIVHLVLPFAFNLLSPLIMLIILTRHKRTVNENSTTWLNFINVLRTHKNNLITPSLLVLLISPRVILTFLLTCITQPWQNTAYIVAYLLSLMPLMTSLFIFVLPSSERREELYGIFRCAIRYARVAQSDE